MKTFYVLHDGSHYLYDDPVLMENHGVATYTEYLGEAMQFESLCQALDFNQKYELELSVLKVEITVAYTPNLLCPSFPGADKLVPQLDDPRWEDATDDLVGHDCYGIEPTGSICKGVLNRGDGYFYIYMYGGFEFGVSKVIKI